MYVYVCMCACVLCVYVCIYIGIGDAATAKTRDAIARKLVVINGTMLEAALEISELKTVTTGVCMRGCVYESMCVLITVI